MDRDVFFLYVFYSDFIAHLFNATWGWYWRTPQSKSHHLHVALCSMWLISAWTKMSTVYGWECIMYIHNMAAGSNWLLCKIGGIHSGKVPVVVFWLWHCVAAWCMSTDVSGVLVASIFMVEMKSSEHMWIRELQTTLQRLCALPNGVYFLLLFICDWLMCLTSPQFMIIVKGIAQLQAVVMLLCDFT